MTPQAKERRSKRLSEASKRIMANPDTRKKYSEKLKGKPMHTAESRKRISDAVKLALANPEVRAKYNVDKIGIKQSVEHRKRISRTD